MTNLTYIIVPTYKQDESTLRCFSSIGKYTQKYRIVWVDNGSGIESIKHVRDFLESEDIPFDLIANKENLGFVGGTNKGIEHALQSECGYIAFVNNDIEVYEGWLDKMKDSFLLGDKVGVVGVISSEGTGLQAVNNLPEQYPDIFSDLPPYRDDPDNFNEIISQKYKGVSKEVFAHVAFFCTLFKRRLVEEIGLLDSVYGIGYFDDNDYCERALRMGWKIYLRADVFVFHNHGQTFKSKFSQEKKMEIFDHNKIVFEKKFKKGVYAEPPSEIEDKSLLSLEIYRAQDEIKRLQILLNHSRSHQCQHNNTLSFKSLLFKIFVKAKRLLVRS